jgi:H+/Cl- antiporter ClcA/CBS domain-containing protein
MEPREELELRQASMSDDVIPYSAAQNREAISPAPSLDLVLEEAQFPAQTPSIDRRVVWLCGVAIALGFVASLVAVVFVRLIALITNFAFYGRFSLDGVSPSENQLGFWVLFIPIIGGLICGLMARFGSKAIRGHGIPEAMEQILTNRSRIPARITFLKPVSAAIAIGTGGPFGAEGPIIATGSALGSMIGQFLRTTPAERKTLLAAGAAAGMAAIFGSPVAAVLLAIELLLFEFRPRSIIPVALASATAAGMRIIFEHGANPVFPMPNVDAPGLGAMAFYIVLGGLMGVAAAAVTRIVYFVEDAFERLPIHFMWWPAIGGAAVGIVGFFVPRTLGVGYENITSILSNKWSIQVVAILCVMKFVSWTLAIGSGTSGGTMAPLFTIGGALGQVLAAVTISFIPGTSVDLGVAAIVGMAALFAGASRAFLACTVFAFEATLQPLSLLPLLGGCAASYLVATLLSKNSLMTEKIVRRGVAAPHEYTPDVLAQVLVRDVASKPVVTLQATQTVQEVRSWIASDGSESRHQGFPVVESSGVLLGVLTRRDLLNPQTPDSKAIRDLLARLPKFVYDDCTVRQAADHMVRHDIGRLPVLNRATPPQVIGIVTRSDILSAFRRGLDDAQREDPTLKVPRLRRSTAKRTA